MRAVSQKTVFIVISRGFIARNILRSGVLERLKNAGLKTVIFFDNGGGDNIPEHLRKEFEDDLVCLEIVPPLKRKGYARFAKLTSLLVSSRSTWQHSQIGNARNLNRAFFWKYVERAFFGTASKLHFLKTLARFIERRFFANEVYAPYFEKYRPVLVFGASIQSLPDINIMKEAEKRGIPTVAMPKGWDNVTKLLYRFMPDILIVHNERMKKEAARIQRIPPSRFRVTGFPQFDWYKRRDILVSRDTFCERYGLDPNKKIIFFGSEGRWAPGDENIISLLVQWINTPGILAENAQLIVRPHFTDVKSGRLMRFKGLPNTVIDDNFSISDFFGDNWDPGVEETKLFTNLIYHCDVLITVASTLTLDGACFDKPLINVAFKALVHPKTGWDISPLLYAQDHYDWVFETNAVDYVTSETELLQSVNAYLENPTLKRAERMRLVRTMCYKVDGKSSERLAEVLIAAAHGRTR